jgi:DNA-binding response OmpR family regulator
MPDSLPPDEALFNAIRAHCMRTRGVQPRRVTVAYDDGSKTSFTLSVLLNQQNGQPSPEAAPAPGWPPTEGWAIRPGEAAFNGTRFALTGKLNAILRELAHAYGEPVTADRLKHAVWGEDPAHVEDGNLQGHVSLLRKKLRDALNLGDVNPIAHSDGAYWLTVF